MADGIRQDAPKPEGGSSRLAKAKDHAWNFLKEKIPWRKPSGESPQRLKSEISPTPALDPGLITGSDIKNYPTVPAERVSEQAATPPLKESAEDYNQRIFNEVFGSIRRIAYMARDKQDIAAELQTLRSSIRGINDNLGLPGRYEQSIRSLNSVLSFSKFKEIAPAMEDAIGIVSTHTSLIENEIKNYNDPNSMTALELLNKVAGITDPRQAYHLKVVDVLNRKIGVVAEGIRSGDDQHVLHYLPYLQQYILELNPLYRDEYRVYAHQATLLLREAVEGSKNSEIWRQIGLMIDSPYTHVSAESYKVLGEELRKYDLDPADLYPAWKLGNPDKTMGYMVSGNMKTISEVSRSLQDPTAVAEMRRIFNLKNFNRYPAEMLIDQYQRREDVEGNQILIATADYDPNGFLQKADQLSAFYTPEVKANANVRFVEFGDEDSAAKVFGNYKEKYGESDDGILIVHGYKHALASGGPGREINTDSLITILQGVYKKTANLVLLSCSTGQAGGLGEAAHERLGLKVTGPDQECNSESFLIRTDKGSILKDSNGRSIIDVKYLPGTLTNKPTTTMVYE